MATTSFLRFGTMVLLVLTMSVVWPARLLAHCDGTKNTALVGHALVGWAVCGGTIALGREISSMTTTLLVHAIVAPLVFALLSMHFFRRYPTASPLRTSLGFVGIVVALDAFIVAPLIERSYAMFSSPLGTWIPFASIWVSTLLVGEAWQQSQARHRRPARRA